MIFQVCGKKKRVSANEVAARKCAEYGKKLPDLDPRGGGLQAPHDASKSHISLEKDVAYPVISSLQVYNCLSMDHMTRKFDCTSQLPHWLGY